MFLRRAKRFALGPLAVLATLGLGFGLQPSAHAQEEATSPLREFAQTIPDAQTRERVRIRFRVWDGDEAQTALRQAVREFEAAYPWIEVRVEAAVYGQYFEKLLAQFAANTAPDVVMLDPANFQRFARRNALLPLNPFYDQVPGFDINAYYEPIVEAHSFRGELFVLPRDIAPTGLIYYNKRLFDEAGIPYPDGTWTWDFEPRPELREQCFTWVMQQLTQVNDRGRVTQYGFAPGWPGVFIEPIMYSLGAQPWDDPEDVTQIRFDQPEVIRAFEWYQDLAFNKRWMPSAAELSSILQSNATLLFIQGRTAMFQSGIWEVPTIRRSLRPGQPDFFEWDIALFPAYKDGTRRTGTGGSGYGIMSTTDHPFEAWLLTAWMAGEPGMTAMAAAGIAQPAIAALAQQAPWIPGPDAPIEQQYPPSRIVTHLAVPYVEFGPRNELWPEVRGFVGAEEAFIFNNTQTPEQALGRGNQRAQARLDTLLATRDLPLFNWPVALTIGLLLVVALFLWVYWPERKIKLTQRQRAESRVAYWFVSPFLIGLVLFTLGPMVLSVLMSFADWDVIMPARFRGLENYQEAFSDDPRFFNALNVTFVYTLVAVPVGIIISLLLALLLNVKVKGMPLFRTLYYLPSLASLVAASLIWRRIFQPEGGLLNTIIYGPEGDWNWLGVASFLSRFAPPGEQINWLGSEQTALSALIIMSLWGAGAGMVILLAGLQGIPEIYYEAAHLDGAKPMQKLWKITVPMLSPALLFVMITGFIGSFQVFTQALVMTEGGPGDATRFYMLHLYQQAFQSLRMGYASALAWLLFLIILVFTLIQLRLSKWVYYEGGSR